MSEVKQVKVDNWGIFFLQRLKHFFNRTDYCDLTLQFQDNAQLKVHRLVLSACTEYFELLERTCEMYEDCLVMPDDLQADVVVPIVNFMYTGQLEFKMDLLERLYQTSLVMNMPVLTKLLDAHRSTQIHKETSSSHSFSTYVNPKRYSKSYDTPKHYSVPSSSNTANNKRSYGKAFQNDSSFRKYKKASVSASKPEFEIADVVPHTSPVDYQSPRQKKQMLADPRPTRYELPEELEADNLYDNSFTNISYTSKPLMVHPETTKRYPPKRTGIFEDPSTSKRFIHGRSTMDIVECKKISLSEKMFDDDPSESICDDQDSFSQSILSIKDKPRDSNQLFDQILDGGPKVTIETKDKQSSNLDHAKIISEVLKKYPHLVKSNKNIKLKILNTPTKKKSRPANIIEDEKEVKQKNKSPLTSDYTYESKVLDSKEAAKLIALGAENITGPWICLICGAPGKAIHFSSYYKFRRHLVEVHNEKPVLHICEYCGQKSVKRNYLLHHLYTKHGVEPPPPFHFPKCNMCNYVALTEGYLIKHKLTHLEKQNFRCNVCASTFSSSNQLLTHIQKTGHKYSADRKTNPQCIYCFRTFTREGNLYAHLRTNHKEAARNDGIIDIFDDEKPEVKGNKVKEEVFQFEVPVTYESEYDADIQYQIQQQPDGNIQLVSKKPRILLPTVKHKILNAGFDTPTNKNKAPLVKSTPSKHNEFGHNTHNSINNQTEEIVMIDNDEYIVKDNQLIPKSDKTVRDNYSMSAIINTEMVDTVHDIIPTSSVQFTNVQSTTSDHHKMIVNKSSSINQPIQIVVSNEEEYKALMASNHSIIFEDGDTNKTLTVLTGPHENNTTIDLDNSQSNDMMIIPENYPLNVTDTASGNNSNIVVVYSHPVDDQNKEYQLITSDNIDAQFVTSTAILTQNYETVTTSAPIMNAHVLETTVEDSWTNNIPQTIATNTDMQVPITINHDPDTPIDNQQGSIANLDEIQLPPIHSEVVEMHSNTDINQINGELTTDPPDANNLTETTIITDATPGVINTNTESNFVETVDSLPSNINTNCTNDDANLKDCSEQPLEELNNGNDIVPQDNINLEDISGVNEVETGSTTSTQETIDSTKFIQNENTQGSSESETIENIAKAIQSTSSEVKSAPQDSGTHESTMEVPIDNGEESTTKAKEKIQNLALEWSDDEIETSCQDQSSSQQDNNIKQVTECEAMDTDSQSELEESIENIQQEMEKQLSRAEQEITTSQSVETLNITENVTNASQKETNIILESEAKKPAEVTKTTKTPDKITSLLNDWEDNDSQEGEADIETPVVENTENLELNNQSDLKQNPESVSVTVETTTDIQSQTDKVDGKGSENIERLVSDWVEDDEDGEPSAPSK